MVRKRRKICALLISFLMLSAMIMTGCGGSGSEKKEKETSAPETETVLMQETAAEEAVTEPVQESESLEETASSETELAVETAVPEIETESVQETEKTETAREAPVQDEAEEAMEAAEEEAPDDAASDQGVMSMFANYYDYQNSDGSYSYYFADCGLTVTMDEQWYQATRVIVNDYGATFYQKASYDAYMKQGFEGGRLFTLGASVNSDFQNYPSFKYIGFNEDDMMNYFAVFPTDYQAYMEDAGVREEYDMLWAGVEDVVGSIQLAGSTQ